MAAAISIIDALDDPALFQRWFPGETWNGWRTVLKAVYGLPMSEDEAEFFRSIAERDPPARPVREAWFIVGRRGGKDSVASVIAAHSAALFDQRDRLRPGERALVMCLAVDRDQAKIVLNYTRSYFADIDLLKGMVQRETANGFELGNGVDIAVATSSFRSVRGRPVLCAIFDEIAFWRDENTANPDDEVYTALKPALASIPGSIIIGISSPYRKSGLLYKKFRDHYGKNGDVLVIKAPTRMLNPMIDQAIIDEALAEDPEAASAEWLAEFRNDIAAYLTREAVEAVVTPGCIERPRVSGTVYTAFVDPSGGMNDSMTMAIAHRDLNSEIAVLDLIRECKPPFSPDSVVHEFCETLTRYGITSVRGDRYAGEWCREPFKKRGISYEVADATKNDLYRSMLPAVNSAKVELLDHKRLLTQIVGLERRTARGGRDSVDHAPGGHDDIANAVAGALHYVANDRRIETKTYALRGLI